MANPIRLIGFAPAAQAVALIANTTLGPAHYGKVLTNRGAAGAITHTLPSPTGLNGVTIYHLGFANQNVIFKTATADTLVVLNDQAADSLAFQTTSQKIGSYGIFYCDGTNWYGLPIRGTGTVVT